MQKDSKLLEVIELTKIYRDIAETRCILKDVSLSILAADYLAIV